MSDTLVMPNGTRLPSVTRDDVEAWLAQASPLQQRMMARILAGRAPSLQDWCKRVSPNWNWDWAHLVLVMQKLEQVLLGNCPRLIIEIPVRHGKSELVTTRFPVFALGDFPHWRFIIGSYNVTLATKFTRRARSLAQESGITLGEKQEAADWETLAGGGMRAAGRGSGVTGHGAQCIIIDDPFASREEAESLTIRDSAWDWFTQDILSRLEPNGNVIVMAARWHFDDVIGRILESEDAANWEVLRLPALAEPNDPLGRAEGEALCPARYDEDTLNALRIVMGEYAFAGLYQQAPKPRSGNMFPREKVQIVDVVPNEATRRVRYWDKAGTKPEDRGKFSAGVRLSVIPLQHGVPGTGIVYIEDVVRGQWEADQRNEVMRLTAQMDPPGTKQMTEQEPGSGGKESAQYTIKLLAGHNVEAHTVTGDKATRADPLSAQWKAGNVRLVRGEWNKPFLDEMEKAPNNKYLDQMDGAAGAFNEAFIVTLPNIRRLT